jgi:nucleotide-binding universal stress UspA family protein
MYRNILVPLDGSELAECSLQHAKAIAKGCNAAELTVFRAVEPLSAQSVAILIETGDDALEKVQYENEKDAQDYISKIESRLKEEGFPSRGVVAEGRPSDEILEYSQKNNVDLIVMSTHGRSGISRFFFGSEAEKVSRHSPIPVLLVSPLGCRNMPVS